MKLMPMKVKLLKASPLTVGFGLYDLKERGQPTTNCPPIEKVNLTCLTWTLTNFILL